MLKNNSSANKILKYSGLAFQLFGTVGLFTWIGTILDEKFKFKDPWMTIILVILSFTAVMFWLYNDLKKNKNE